MDFYGWNETKNGNPHEQPSWSNDEQGTVYDILNYPVDAPEESVRTSMTSCRQGEPRRRFFFKEAPPDVCSLDWNVGLQEPVPLFKAFH